jgi:hypothetical protein
MTDEQAPAFEGKPPQPGSGATSMDWYNAAVEWYDFVDNEIGSMSYTEHKTGIDVQCQMGLMAAQIGQLAKSLGL